MLKNLNTPIRYLKGVGPKKAGLLNELGIHSVEDALYYFPRRYEDRTKFVPVSQLKKDETQTIKATVLVKNQRQSWKRRGFNILEVVVGDDSGRISCVWFNQPYLKDYFKTGQIVIMFGRIQEYSGRLQMTSPEFEIVTEAESTSLDIGRVVPVYTLPEGITQRYFRKIIKNCLDEHLPKIKEILPYEIRVKHNLLNLAKSLIDIHFPENLEFKKQAYRRLSFEEFFLFQIPIALRKLKKKEYQGLVHKIEG